MADGVTLPGEGRRPFPRVGDETLALAALGFLLSVTAAWWAVALWPLAETAPGWLQTARAVCFGAHDDGLPNAGGWILLIGEPIGMGAALWILWGGPLAAGLRGLASSRGGRGVLAAAAVLVLAGVAAAGLRVTGGPGGAHAATAAVPALSALDAPAPPLGLVDQHGERLELERFRGRPVLVTFAYGQCRTVCPLLVSDALRVRDGFPGTALVVVTLDPWRDTPPRLPHIAASWGLGADAHVVTGEPARVEEVLAAWGATGSRDPRTGEVVHPPLTVVVDAAGRLAFATSGTVDELTGALLRVASR
jgi:protein SCO1